MSGGALPPLRRIVSARDIAMGAAASRDWQPQHHDIAYAQGMKLPDIIMNAPTQTGWFHAYAMAWAGPGARIARWRLKMRRPVCPGAAIAYSGSVLRQETGPPGALWIWLDLECRSADERLSAMALLLARPDAAGGDCAAIPADVWHPPALDPA